MICLKSSRSPRMRAVREDPAKIERLSMNVDMSA